MNHTFRVFGETPMRVRRCAGNKIYLDSGDVISDFSAGGTSFCILGWGEPRINDAIKDQLERFAHVDYKMLGDPNVDALSRLVISQGDGSLTRMYFAGNAGGEAVEAAIKISYQSHCARRKINKSWYISRRDSYHGSSLDAMALGDRQNLEIFSPMFPKNRSKIDAHNVFKFRKPAETIEEYENRSVEALEREIQKIGPENIGGFVAETIAGGLVGDVPPTETYWKKIRQICNRYDIHLILDEVYCGTGTTGRYFAFSRYQVVPDIVVLGKTLAAGYAPISACITSEAIHDDIRGSPDSRLNHTTTHQGYSLGCAAAIAVQSIIKDEKLTERCENIGADLRKELQHRLDKLNIVKNIRGLGLRFSIEHNFSPDRRFAEKLHEYLFTHAKMFVNSKWHRISFTPAINLELSEYYRAVEAICDGCKKVLKI